MAASGRAGTLFVAGILVGALVGGGVALSLRGHAKTEVAAPAVHQGGSARSAPSARSTPVAMKPEAAAQPQQTTASANCDFSPVAAKGEQGDGQEKLATSSAGATEDEVASRLLRGKEAAASGHARDAEVAFLDACRKAETLRHPKGTPLADAMYQLGRHYGNLALAGAPKKTELLRRSRLLYTASLQSYRARYGEEHEKTRFARQGLARLPQAGTAVAIEAPAKPAIAAPAKPATAAAPKAKPEDPPRPSFDCRRARSKPEKIICSDAELARLDRELGQLHAQAEAAARDPAAFKRQNDAQWLRREATCRDRACLLDWYAQRREQLLGDLGSQQATR